MKEQIPIDRWLIQESLQKVQEGSDALMKWAQKNSHHIDQKFMNQLNKMIKYSRKENNEQRAKVFEFLKKCFEKMFNFDILYEPMTISQDNLKKSINEATQLLKQGKTKSSISILEGVMLFLKQYPDENYQAVVEANLGIAYAQINVKDKAVQHLQNAIRLKLDDNSKEKVLANFGTVLRGLQKYEPALDYFQQAYEISKKRNDREMQCIYLTNIALVHFDKKDLSKSLKIQEEAYKVAKKIENKKMINDCMTRLAVINALKGNHEISKELCQEALDLLQKKE